MQFARQNFRGIRGRLCGQAVVLVAILSCVRIATCQEQWGAEPDGLVSPSQQLAIEQIGELLDKGQNEEALAQVRRLTDFPQSLVRAGRVQIAGTQRVQGYRTLQEWCVHQQKQLLSSDPELNEAHRRQWNSQAEVAYQSLQKSKSIAEGSAAVVRFHATDFGTKLVKLLVDTLLENAQGLAALQVQCVHFAELSQVDLSSISELTASNSVPWHRAWQVAELNSPISGQLVERWKETVGDRQSLAVDVVARQLVASAMHPELLDLEAGLKWAGVVSTHSMDPSSAQSLPAVIESVKDWTRQDNPILPAVFHLDQWPELQVQLERYSNSYDLTPSTRPPIGQLQSLLPTQPVIHEGRVYLHELTRIRAFQLDQGTSWPSAATGSPLFDSQVVPAAYLPLGYPTLGAPRGMVSIREGCLYARMGTPVTAWANRVRSNDGSSNSYLIGLDLASQGKMLQGFPLHLAGSEFDNAEFEGCPVVSGQLLITTVTQRDHGNIRRRLAAFDRFNGRLIWSSQVLGRGAVVGSQRANLISNAQPVVAAGLVYFSTDLGTIACLNAQSGQLVWLCSYQPARQQESDYPRPDRFRYRDGNPCVIHRGLVYCLPQDCPELLALDALSGDLVWSTNEIDVADCSHIAGVAGESILVSGDRLVWLDRTSGSPLGHFPALTTPGIVNSLPQPRGLGRPALADGKVYWPTSGEVYVFQADMSAKQISGVSISGTPKLLKQVATGSRGGEGGNLVACGEWMVMVTPGRLVCFRSK